MDALEVCVSRIVSCLYQSLETSLHQSAYAAAENCLLAEEVCLCLCLECCLKDTCSRTADRKAVSQRHIKCLSGIILLNSYQTRCSFSCLILASYCVSRSLRSDDCNVYVCRRYNLSEVDVESVFKHQHIAFLKVRLDVVLI